MHLGKGLKAQTYLAKKHQKLHHIYEFDRTIKKEKPTLENYSELDRRIWNINP